METTHSYSFWADFNIFSTIIEICIGAKVTLYGSVIELLSRFCFILIDCPFLLFYQGEYVCYFFIDIALYKYYFVLFGFWEHSNGFFYLHQVDQIGKVTVSTISLCFYSTVIFSFFLLLLFFFEF